MLLFQLLLNYKVFFLSCYFTFEKLYLKNRLNTKPTLTFIILLLATTNVKLHKKSILSKKVQNLIHLFLYIEINPNCYHHLI